MKKLFVSFLIAASLLSCTEEHQPQRKVKLINGTVDEVFATRNPNFISSWPIKVLENGTRTFVRLTQEEASNLFATDTIWVDLGSHRLNDTANYTMKCVVYWKQ